MRPYLAILKDSFREALASRLLWVLLILISLLLVGLAPISAEPAAADPEFQVDHIRHPALLTKALAEARDADEPSPAARIRPLLSETFQQQLDEANAAEAPFEMQWRLAEQLNGLLERRGLYQEAAWRDIELPEDAQELLGGGVENLSDEEVARLNRLLIEAAFPAAVDSAPASAVRVSYPFLGDTRMPYDMQQVRTFVKQVIWQLIQWLVGVFGVLLAILVTAPIIPKTFEPGAVSLLLSKPVLRPLLFLTKFLGGCAFLLLNAAYLLVGLWLIAGWRFDIWSGNLLLCIPVVLFLFMIYYSVSALVGVVWNNWILCVIFTALFWVVCASVGWTKGIIETFFLEPAELTAVASPAEQEPIVRNRRGEILQWQSGSERWEEIVSQAEAVARAPFGMRLEMQRLSYDPHGDRLLLVDSAGVTFGRASSAELIIFEQQEGWRQLPRIALPPGASQVFATPHGEILAVGPAGIFQLDELPEADETAEDAAEFMEIGPSVSWGEPFAATVHPETGDLVVYERRRLHRLRKDDAGRYVTGEQSRIDAEGAVRMAHAGADLLIATSDGELRLWNVETSQQRDSLTPLDDRLPRQVIASPDGRWGAVLSREGELWLYDTAEQTPVQPRIGPQGEISAVTFAADRRVLVAHNGRRVTTYELAPLERQARFAPPQSRLELAYHYAIHPLYTIFPKPGRLDDVVSYLLIDEEEPEASGRVQRERISTFDLWTAVLSNIAFMAVILAATSFYVHRKDF